MRKGFRKFPVLSVLSPILSTGLLAAALLGITGCSPTVMVEQDPQAGLPGNGSYAWGIASDHIAGDNNPRVNNDIIAAKVQQAIDTGFARRGYKLVDKTQAAWLVHYHAGLEKQTEVVSSPVYPSAPRVVCGAYRCTNVYDWGFYGPPESVTRTVTFHEGTLLVDIHDARTNKLVWRGTLSDEVNVNKPLDQTALQKAVDKLLLKLPAAH